MVAYDQFHVRRVLRAAYTSVPCTVTCNIFYIALTLYFEMISTACGLKILINKDPEAWDFGNGNWILCENPNS